MRLMRRSGAWKVLNNLSASVHSLCFLMKSMVLSVVSCKGVGGGFGAGGLAALAQLGLGAGGAGKKIRVQKRTVIDMSESSGNAQFLVQLKSSQGMLTISSDNLSSDEVLTFVRAFPIKDLDEALEP